MPHTTITPQKALLVIISSCFVYGLSIGMNFVIVPLMFTNDGASKSLVGLLMGIEITAAFCISPFLPYLARRFGMGRIVLLSAMIRNIMLLVLPLYHGALFWLPAMFIAGSGGFTLFISIQIWVNSLSTAKHRATMLSAFTAILSLGIAVGPLLLHFTGRTGFTPFLVSSLLCSLILLPFYFIRSTLPQQIEKARFNVFSIIRKSPIALLGGTVSDFIFFSMSSFLVLYGLSYGLSEAQAALLITAMMVGGIVLEVPVGWLSDHINRQLMGVICTLVLLVSSQLLSSIIESQLLLWVFFAIFSGAIGGIYTSNLALLAEAFKDKDLIAANSAFAMMNSFGGICGVMLTGVAMDIWGPEGLSYSIAFVCVAYLMLNTVRRFR